MLKFENPDLLLLLWVALLQGFLLWLYWRWRRRTLRLLGSPVLAQRLLLGFSAKRFWWKNALFGLALVLLVLAIANPRRMVKREADKQQSADIVLALDISQSMLARDAAPSRLEQARDFAQKLVQALETERIGLLFFAGDAFPQAPLSTDHEAVLLLLRNASPEFIADQGTAMGAAVDLAQRMFESNSAAGRGLILLSDGENHLDSAVPKARDARKEGLTIYTVGVGGTEGTTIPLANGSPKRDGLGQIVQTKADPGALRDLAEAGGGAYFQANDGDQAVRQLARELGRLQKAAVEARAHTDYISYFQWLLLPCLLLLIAEQVLWWRSRTT